MKNPGHEKAIAQYKGGPGSSAWLERRAVANPSPMKKEGRNSRNPEVPGSNPGPGPSLYVLVHLGKLMVIFIPL